MLGSGQWTTGSPGPGLGDKGDNGIRGIKGMGPEAALVLARGDKGMGQETVSPLKYVGIVACGVSPSTLAYSKGKG